VSETESGKPFVTEFVIPFEKPYGSGFDSALHSEFDLPYE